MSKRILILGISGFVGANFMNYVLENTDWEIIGLASWVHKGEPTRVTESKLYQANKDRVTIFTHDLTMPITDILANKIGEIDYLANLASESHVTRSIADPLPFIQNNVSLMLNVLEYARKYPPKILLNFSSDEVLSDVKTENWDVLAPANPYSASKACQELICHAYFRTYSLPIIITRSNNIVGPSQADEKYIPMLIKLIAAGKEVQIHTAKGRPGRRYYNSVNNVSSALLFILNREPSIYGHLSEISLMSDGTFEPGITTKPDRYNIPGGVEMDNLEMAQLVAKLMGKELKYKLIDAETVRSGYDEYYSETNGALTKLGWKPNSTLEQELSRLVKSS